MPELLLHIGTHKTGTTSIQRFLSENRRELRNRGVWYPPTTVGRFPKHYAHHRIAHAIAGADEAFDIGDARHYFERVKKNSRGDERVLMSAEPMYRHVLQATPAESEDGRNDGFARYVDAVGSCVDGFDVHILVMVRRQDHFVESLYAEQVLATGYERSIGRFLAERHDLLDYQSRLGTWAERFGDDRVSVQVYEPTSSAHSIEQMFVEWLGLAWDADSLEVGPKINVTPARTFVEFKRMMNFRAQDEAVSRQYRQWIERLSKRLDQSNVPGLGKRYLPPEDRARLLDECAVGNQAVAERFCGRPELFNGESDDGCGADYVRRNGLNDRQFRMIARELFSMIAEEGSTEAK